MEPVRGTVSEEKSSSNPYLIERREAKRILVNAPFEVTEIDGEGHPITDRTFIEDVSDFGCRFSPRGPVKQGDTIAVKMLGFHGNNLPDEAPRLYEIIWVAGKDHGSSIGARVLQEEKLANAKFPLKTSERSAICNDRRTPRGQTVSAAFVGGNHWGR
jgi:hypothetical protein